MQVVCSGIKYLWSLEVRAFWDLVLKVLKVLKPAAAKPFGFALPTLLRALMRWQENMNPIEKVERSSAWTSKSEGWGLGQVRDQWNQWTIRVTDDLIILHFAQH